MKFGIGVDCEEISRFKKIGVNKKFLEKIFTKKEINYCKSKPNPFPHLAARFAGKEAIIKAANNTGKQLFFNEVEILNDKKGIPYVNISNKVNKKFNVKISLSHSKDTAIAFAVVIDGKNG